MLPGMTKGDPDRLSKVTLLFPLACMVIRIWDTEATGNSTAPTLLTVVIWKEGGRGGRVKVGRPLIWMTWLDPMAEVVCAIWIALLPRSPEILSLPVTNGSSCAVTLPDGTQ